MGLSSEMALTLYSSDFKALLLTLIILANLRSMKYKMVLFALTFHFAGSKIKLLPF